MTEQLLTRFVPSLITADGRFSGYGAYFGNVDSHRDEIVRGAFAASLRRWRAKGKWPSMRLMHGDNGPNPFRFDNLPIGRWLDMHEDTSGLFVEGQLLALDTELGRRLHALMSAAVLDGLSIGFVPTKTRNGTGRVLRYLDEVDLIEISIVDEPSNDLARIEQLSPTDAAFDRLRDAIASTAEKSADPDAALKKLRLALARAERHRVTQ